ncbi:MAG: hypothetical protein ACYC6B_07565 [Thermoleophilia bacterium]
MDTMQDNRHVAGVVFLAIMIVACAWLIPISKARAASSADGFSVRVTVMDSIQTSIGQVPVSSIANGRINQMVTDFVTRTGFDLPSGRLISGPTGNSAFAGKFFTGGLGVRFFGHNVDSSGGATTIGSEPTAEIMVTFTSL